MNDDVSSDDSFFEYCSFEENPRMKGLRLVFCLFIALFPAVLSLNCWRCTNEQSFCDDPFSGNPFNESHQFFEECKPPSYSSLRQPTRVVCMKKKFLTTGSSEAFIERSCRWEHSGTPKDSCKHEQWSADFKIDFCETCENDGCNRSLQLKAWSVLILLSAFANLMRTEF